MLQLLREASFLLKKSLPKIRNKEQKLVEQSGRKVTKSDEQWREQLSEEEFRVCREQGTEPPFSGKLLHNKETGVSTCCTPLFVSDNKYDSGCGWPSFDAPINDLQRYLKDLSHGMVRTEIRCTCDSHLVTFLRWTATR